MTIGIDARFFGPKQKGLGRYTQKLIGNLEKIDTDNNYVVFLRRENFDEYQPQNPRFKKVLADFRWYSLVEQIFLPRLIKKQRVDLMHWPHFNAPIFYRGKFVVTIHDLILRHFATRRASTLGFLKYWLKNLAYRLVIWSAIKRAQKIITVSQYVKNDIIKSLGAKLEKVEVIYEGGEKPVSSFQFPVSSLEKYKISQPYLLYVGNAYPHKNLERLIEAFGILVNNYDFGGQLVLVGENDYFYQQLKKQVNTFILRSMKVFDQIIFAGFVTDEELAEFYQNASVYVFPSLCEGFGLPPLEAMSQGAPVVASSATCLPEILGEAAIYFDPLSPVDMAAKINSVLNDESLRRALARGGYEQIKKYSWEQMARETLAVYNEIRRI